MKSAQSPPIDFNQMLVASVFFHFFLFTAFMFLPQTQDTVRKIKPAFTVNFVNIPTGPPDVEPAPPAKEVSVAPPVPPKPPAAEKPTPKPKVEKPIPAPKPIPRPKVAKPIPKPVPKPKPIPERSAASKALVSKLDELAKKTTAKKDKTDMVIPKPKESFLDDFKKTKMQTEIEKKKKPTPKIDTKKKLTPEEEKFQELSEKTATQKSQKKTKRSSSLLKDLDELSDMNKQHAALSKPKTNEASSKPSELVKRLEAIQKESSNITIDFSKLSSSQSRKFKSGLPSMKFSKAQKGSAAPAASGESGDPAATALSLYLGKAQILINEQWKNPAGGGSGKVQISFKIFPNGKIENPKIKKSSGVSKLDNLALLAIKNAALPPFPREIREPNLPFIIEFTYETKKR